MHGNGPDENLIHLAAERAVGGAVVVRISGEVDMDTAPTLDEFLRAHLDDRARVLVLDCTGVTFLGSAGLNLLVSLRSECRRRATALHLVASTRTVLLPLEFTGLKSLFHIVSDVAEAV